MPSLQIVLATTNTHKIAEIVRFLGETGHRFRPISEYPGYIDPEETGDTFEANARLKADAAARFTGCAALADDSGIVVPALGGEPGVKSARWAGPGGTQAMLIEKMMKRMGGQTDRRAWFQTVLVLRRGDGDYLVAEGRVDGVILEAPRGAQGFGYDPLFLPIGGDKTFAELSMDEKNKLSHRARALAEMLRLMAR